MLESSDYIIFAWSSILQRLCYFAYNQRFPYVALFNVARGWPCQTHKLTLARHIFIVFANTEIVFCIRSLLEMLFGDLFLSCNEIFCNCRGCPVFVLRPFLHLYANKPLSCSFSSCPNRRPRTFYSFYNCG